MYLSVREDGSWAAVQDRWYGSLPFCVFNLPLVQIEWLGRSFVRRGVDKHLASLIDSSASNTHCTYTIFTQSHTTDAFAHEEATPMA
jgi:hypothetical protein